MQKDKINKRIVLLVFRPLHHVGTFLRNIAVVAQIFYARPLSESPQLQVQILANADLSRVT